MLAHRGKVQRTPPGRGTYMRKTRRSVIEKIEHGVKVNFHTSHIQVEIFRPKMGQKSDRYGACLLHLLFRRTRAMPNPSTSTPLQRERRAPFEKFVRGVGACS